MKGKSKRRLQSPSIPFRQPSVQLKLKSQNHSKLLQYQYEHMLDRLGSQEGYQCPKITEQIPELPQSFSPKKKKDLVTLPEFLQKQYPPPFNGAQAISDDFVDPMPFRQYIQVKPCIQAVAKPDDDGIDKKSEQQTIKTIDEMMRELSQGHDQYIEEFCDNLAKNKKQQKVNEFLRKPLNELIKLEGHFPQKVKDSFRALSKEEKNFAEKNHQKAQLSLEQKLQAKKSVQELEADMENNKRDYFKIIRELDMLNKGAKQLLNYKNQGHNLRKKVDPPNIDKLIKDFKYGILYQEGMTEKYEREMNLIRYKNEMNNLPLAGLNWVDRFKLVDKEVPCDVQEAEVSVAQSRASKNSQHTQNTQVTRTESSVIKISQKAQEMQKLLSDDIF